MNEEDIDTGALLNLLPRHFSKEEFRALLLTMGIDPNEIEKSPQELSLALMTDSIGYLKRRGRIIELYNAVKKERPFVLWDNMVIPSKSSRLNPPMPSVPGTDWPEVSPAIKKTPILPKPQQKKGCYLAIVIGVIMFVALGGIIRFIDVGIMPVATPTTVAIVLLATDTPMQTSASTATITPELLLTSKSTNAATSSPSTTPTLAPSATPNLVTPILNLSAPTPVSEKCSMLAFQSDRDGDKEIFTLNIESGEVAQLTFNQESADTGPAWSPDGTKIAFESFRDGNFEIYVMNADGSEQRRLTDNPAKDLAPSWSPDGSKIVFQSDRIGIFQIFTIDVNSKQEERITITPYQNYAPVWSPDGNKIAYYGRRENEAGNSIYDIFVVDLRRPDDPPTQLAGTGLGMDMDPQWSPDGSEIIFVAKFLNQGDIYLMASDGTRNQLFEENAAVDQYPTWGLTCAKVAFESNRDSHSPGPDQFDIYVKEPNGTVTRLTFEDSNEEQPSWRP